VVSVAAVCRRHDISTRMVFRWRIQFGFGAEQPARLASVAVAGTEKVSSASVNGRALVLQDRFPTA
jgi:transposase-like protein